MLGKLSVPGRPTTLDDSRARAYCACSRCGWGFVWTFFLSSVFSLFFLSLFGRRPDIVGQGPIALAVGAGGGLFEHFFSHLSFLFSFSLSLGDGPI